MVIQSGRSASVKDVAAAAGVSLGTVSNVLNRPDRVSSATRARVEQAMATLGFVRNESARQLRAGPATRWPTSCSTPTNPFFTDVAAGIENAAQDRDLSLFLCTSNNDAAREAAPGAARQQRVQGSWSPRRPVSPTLDQSPGTRPS